MSDAQEGFDFLAENEFAAAREVFEAILAVAPDDLDALFGLARSWDCNCDFDRFMDLTDLHKARDVYEQILARDEWDLEAIYYLSRVLMQQGEHVDAMRRVREGLEVDPTHPDLLSTFGMLLYDENQMESAYDVQMKALYHGGSAAFLNELSLISRALGRDGEAERHLRFALEIDPNASWAWRNLAQLLADRGDFPEAVTCGKHYFATGGMEIDMEELIREWETGGSQE